MRNVAEEPPKVSPFTEVRYDGDKAIVRVRGEVYELVSIDGIEAGKILKSAKDQFGYLWQKRFAEDLVEVLWKMDHRPKSTVELRLRKPASAEIVSIADAEMTEDNRRHVRHAGK
jgi:serine/threonine-protein kinase